MTERFPDHRSTDVETRAEVALDEALARLELRGNDRLTKQLDDLFAERRSDDADPSSPPPRDSVAVVLGTPRHRSLRCPRKHNTMLSSLLTIIIWLAMSPSG